MMGGDVAVESELGQGSTFTITLPADVEQDARRRRRAGRPAAAAATPADRRVLVVDDDPTDRELLAPRSRAGRASASATAGGGREGFGSPASAGPTRSPSTS